MNLGQAAAAVREGRTVTFRAYGHSMSPRIRHGDEVTVEPLNGRRPKKGQVVLVRVGPRWYLHLVTGIRPLQLQISNNHGHVNGWTSKLHVAGLLRE